MKQTVLIQTLMACLLFLSAVALVYVQHRHRALYVELQTLERERDALEVEWGKLQLEQSTWAAHERVESLARKRLGLRVPPMNETVLVTR